MTAAYTGVRALDDEDFSPELEFQSFTALIDPVPARVRARGTASRAEGGLSGAFGLPLMFSRAKSH